MVERLQNLGFRKQLQLGLVVQVVELDALADVVAAGAGFFDQEDGSVGALPQSPLELVERPFDWRVLESENFVHY